MKIALTIIMSIILSTSGWYIHNRSNHMRHTCDSLSGEFYTISFDEGTCIIGKDVVHLHYHS